MKPAISILAILLLGGCVRHSSLPDRSSKSVPALVAFESGGKFGYKDQAGKIVIAPKYDIARTFAYGLACVNLGAKWEFPGLKMGGKWGYINTRGEVVVPFTFTDAHDFSDGLARVEDSKGTRYIDQNGQSVISLGDAFAGDFREGLAPVLSPSPESQNFLTRYINKRGETVFEVDGYGGEFHQGLAVLAVLTTPGRDHELFGFINHKGDVAIQPSFGKAYPFSEGLAAVMTDSPKPFGTEDEWGYIDQSGEYVIKPRFNEVGPFLKGLALVHLGGELIPLEDAPFVWEGGEWLVIDKKGEVLKRSDDWLGAEAFAKRERKAADNP